VTNFTTKELLFKMKRFCPKFCRSEIYRF